MSEKEIYDKICEMDLILNNIIGSRIPKSVDHELFRMFLKTSNNIFDIKIHLGTKIYDNTTNESETKKSMPVVW